MIAMVVITTNNNNKINYDNDNNASNSKRQEIIEMWMENPVECFSIIDTAVK